MPNARGGHGGRMGSLLGRTARATGERAGRFFSYVGGGIAAVPGAIHEAVTREKARAQSAQRVVVSKPLTTAETLALLAARSAGQTDLLTPEHLAQDLGKSGVGASMNTNISAKMFNRYIGHSTAIKGFFKTRWARLNEGALTARIVPLEDLPDLDAVRDDGQFAVRAVASSVIDHLLGTNVIAESAFARMLNPETGALEDGYISAGAPGTSLITKHADDGSTWNDIDLSQAAVQRGLSDLQVNDWLSGQIDRHPGNIFIDPSSGRVTGIDNDLAFGERCVRQFSSGGTFGIGSNRGIPQQVDYDTAKRVLALSPDTLRASLAAIQHGADRLTDAQIEAAVDRLVQLQNSIRSGAVNVIKVWNDKTFQAATSGIDEDTPPNVLTKISGGDEFNDGTGSILRSVYAGQISDLASQKKIAGNDEIRQILADRGMVLNGAQMHKLLGNQDLAVLETWKERARTAATVEEIFA